MTDSRTLATTGGLRILIAPDSFKGSISAREAVDALRRGWLSERPDDAVTSLPMADGGEGTLEAIAYAVPGTERVPVEVAGPLGDPHRTAWLRTPDGTAVVELASTSGIELLDALAPWDAHTAGFGMAIAAAIAAGCNSLALAIGGSASTDAGTGMLRALGARMLGDDGHPVALGAGGLSAITSIDLSAVAPPPGHAAVLTDVTHPLLGPRGAAAVFGPQKGFLFDDLSAVEAALAHVAGLLPADADAAGAGAAGGTGFGLLCWGATIESGADAVADLVGLDAAISAADLVITGEGRFDEQTAGGKVASVVYRRAADAGRPVAMVAGSIAADTSAFRGVQELASLAGDAARAIADPVPALIEAGRRLAGSV